ncbi:pyridoxal-phosphate dependent enzyme [Mangrovihabitans endophyticus]|uniref:D-cysteine desulfhydrase n=1 Tax=Mangrovihabitans endophyticus TaxID=1751298 RepID=A0A8J3BXU4_9ACTN|nr:pyridoxal-phosphate dependent enzyme [Mangrovihabitans endophyticus]GGK81119.1 D-cysteine desulfhydrase [Mangrovihabitans endophyticus]
MISLGTWPTPLEPAPRLAAALGIGELWIKRDDLTGLGGGGNKVRKLQFLCAEALRAGATTLITVGAPQSNHARLTAAAAARLGLRSVLVLHGEPPSRLSGNLVLDHLAGAQVVWNADPEAIADSLRATGDRPHVIPLGGSTPSSVQAYVDCAREITEQLPNVDQVVTAVGSGGTMAGLVTGLGPERVLGVDTGALPDPCAAIAALAPGVPADRLAIDRGQVGPGYHDFTERVRDALKLAARTEGLFLDPTYTGRALAGLIAAGPHRGRVVFLHTGGLPGLFGHPQL